MSELKTSYQEQMLHAYINQGGDFVLTDLPLVMRDCFAVQRLEKEIENIRIGKTIIAIPDNSGQADLTVDRFLPIRERQHEISEILSKYNLKP